MIRRLVVFGATGDLSARYLLPGLAALHAAGHLDGGFRLVGADRSAWDSDRFRSWAAEQLDRHGAFLPAADREAIVGAAEYRRTDATDPADIGSAIAGDGPVAVYLALPPALFPAVVNALHRAGLPPGSRIVLEKPFGEDFDRAAELNRLLADLVPEQAEFRVDNFL
ncbi:MAG: glucose-6-phosphate dehydrogenase, partial [Streptomycetaceae bacterium]|nr:glucose-6-phosphate dehydrogenase [Streptomycetaceae bacterium]